MADSGVFTEAQDSGINALYLNHPAWETLLITTQHDYIHSWEWIQS